MCTRWFSQSVRAEALFIKLRPGSDRFDTNFKNVGLWFGSGVGVVLACLALLILCLSIGAKEKGVKPQYGKVAGILVAISGLGGLAAGGYAANSNHQLKKRIFAFDDATKKYDVKHCGNIELTEEYRLPLFHASDYHDIGGSGKSLHAWLCGKWKEDEFAWLEGRQLVDPVFRGKDNAGINLALLAAFGAKGNKQNRLKWKAFETVVFSEELPLPDIILGHSGVVETSYTRKALQGTTQALPGMPMSAKLGAWGATSDPRGAQGIYGAIADVFHSRNCLIQVLGGRVVVFVNYYGAHSNDGTSSLKELEKHMDFAHTIFKRLKLIAQAQASGDIAEITSDANAEVFKSYRGKHISVPKVAIGLSLVLLGLLSMVGMWKLSQTQTVFKEQMVEQGLITACSLEESESNFYGRKIVMARPVLEYSYRVNGQEYQNDVDQSNTKEFYQLDKAAAMIENYAEGMAVTVYVDGADPENSSLIGEKPPLLKEQDLKGQFVVCAMFMAGGLCLAFFGLLNPTRAPVIPDSFTDGSKGAFSGKTASGPVPVRPSTLHGIPLPVAEESDFGNLSSAKYFQNTSHGILD